MDSKIVAQCSCGKKYKVTADKAGKHLKCKNCGEAFVVPDGAPASAPPRWTPEESSLAPAITVEGDIRVKDPDELMVEVNRSIVVKTLVVSFLAHFLIIGLTSFSLYADWSQYGVNWPTEIKRIKKEEAEKAEQAKRDAERAAREKERAERLAKEEEKKKEEEKAAGKKPETPGAEPEGDAGTTAEGGREKTSYEKKLEEKSFDRPADTSVSLDDALQID